MVSDSELIGRLREFLRNSDLDTTTTGIVRRQLEQDFGVDLSDKKAFIREQVDLFLQSQFESAEEHDANYGEEDDQKANVKSEETDNSDVMEDGGDDEGIGEEEEEARSGKSAAKKGLVIN